MVSSKLTNYEANNILINYLMKKAKKPIKKVAKKKKITLAVKGLV
jgi:hypothetical protein